MCAFIYTSFIIVVGAPHMPTTRLSRRSWTRTVRNVRNGHGRWMAPTAAMAEVGSFYLENQGNQKECVFFPYESRCDVGVFLFVFVSYGFFSPLLMGNMVYMGGRCGNNLFAQSVGWVVVQAYPQFEEKYGFSLKHVPSKPRVGPQSNNTSKQYDILITRG